VLKPTLCAAFEALQRPHLAKKLHTDAIVGYPLLLFVARDHTAETNNAMTVKGIMN
jgi:hypothetical protein